MKAGYGEARLFFENAKGYLGDECLIWPYSRKGRPSNRRPQIIINGKNYLVSRLICEHANGHPTSPNLEAAHACGNGSSGCITRNHLRWATPWENGQDRIKHGRSMAKLNNDAVYEMRKLWPDITQTDLAKRFGVSHDLVSLIVRRKAWKHI